MLPAQALWHPHDLFLSNFEIRILDLADVAVSKLKRWNADDREDIRAMIEGDHLERRHFLSRFQEVIERYRSDGRADLLRVMAQRFNQAEEDWFGVDGTPFHFPEELFR